MTRPGGAARRMWVLLLVLLVPVAGALVGCKERRTIRRIDIHHATPTPEPEQRASGEPAEPAESPSEDPAPSGPDGEEHRAGGS